jgi:hypothetical protein
VSIVPEVARDLSEGCQLVEIEPKASRRVGYIRLELRYLSNALKEFTVYLQESAAKRKRQGEGLSPCVAGPRQSRGCNPGA